MLTGFSSLCPSFFKQSWSAWFLVLYVGFGSLCPSHRVPRNENKGLVVNFDLYLPTNYRVGHVANEGTKGQQCKECNQHGLYSKIENL